MARKRMIDPSFWTDEKLGECSIQERLLFMGLISNADDEGYGRANPKLLKSLIFPYDDFKISDIEKWINTLGKLKIVVLFEYEGQTYYNLPNFLKHQTINRPTQTTFPTLELDGVTLLTECSLSAHAQLSANRKEEKGKEEKRKEEKDDFVMTYSRECPKLPQIRTLTDSRKKAIGLFKKTYTLKDFEEVCRIANTCDFLLGVNDRGWKADFDFLIKVNNAVKVLEGKYSNNAKSQTNNTYKDNTGQYSNLSSFYSN